MHNRLARKRTVADWKGREPGFVMRLDARVEEWQAFMHTRLMRNRTVVIWRTDETRLSDVVRRPGLRAGKISMPKELDGGRLDGNQGSRRG